jgi:hypothetical protein
METLRKMKAGVPAGEGTRRTFFGLLWLALALALPAAAQNGVPYQPSQASPQFKVPPGTPATEFDSPDQRQEQQRLKAINAARQKSLVSDTNKLLKLANELNAEIARSNAGTLTPEQLHKVAEIEKLARNVKEKMTTPVMGLEPPGMYPTPMQ